MDKKIFVFLLVAVVALSLSAVSATDDVDVSASYDDGTVAGEANDISIDVTAKDIDYGEDATVEAKIIPNTTAGNIKFSLDEDIVQTGVITNGSASVIFTNLETGKHSVIASYDGINSTPVVFNVNKISAYVMTVKVPYVSYGNDVSAVITLLKMQPVM